LPGLIFTFVWSLEQESDKTYIDQLCAIFRERGADIYFVELQADLSERLKRNESEFRLAQKPSKRDVAKSRETMLEHVEKNRFNTNDDFFYKENYLKVDNTSLTAAEAARRIVEAFGLAIVEAAGNG
jgi:hypothetical protein